VGAGFGRVISVSSSTGRIARPGGANCGPARAYAGALSEERARDQRGGGAHVTARCPGFVRPDLHESAGWTEMERELRGWIQHDLAALFGEGLDAAERGRAIAIAPGH
jgi:NAD(P)-dependent dehydrogenase (short-subunit alcohol dehydrogenase family)